jgi:hypothetical protein
MRSLPQAAKHNAKQQYGICVIFWKRVFLISQKNAELAASGKKQCKTTMRHLRHFFGTRIFNFSKKRGACRKRQQTIQNNNTIFGYILKICRVVWSKLLGFGRFSHGCYIKIKKYN